MRVCLTQIISLADFKPWSIVIINIFHQQSITDKLHATDLRVFPLMNKVNSNSIAVPWFRLTLIDPAIRVLFHQFQTTFNQTELPVAIGTNQMQSKYCQRNIVVPTVNIPKPKRFKVMFVKINKDNSVRFR